MKSPILHAAKSSTDGGRPAALAAAVLCLLALPGAARAAESSPLPRSDYSARSVCARTRPHRARCLALTLVPLTARARARTTPLGVTRARALTAPSPAGGSFGLRPADLHSAYSLPDSAPAGQTVAIVDAYNDPNAESDLLAYSQEFSLPECTAGNGCLRKVNEHGQASGYPFPLTSGELEAAQSSKSTLEKERAKAAIDWGVEISLDIESTHAVCQNCKIILVEAASESNSDLETAEATAESLGASEISNSWGGSEEGETPEAERASPFDHPGTVITASAGDNGYLGWDTEEGEGPEAGPIFPASSPHVVAVGGTRLTLGPSGQWSEETVWNGSGAGGGGCSNEFSAPEWQRAVSDWPSIGCGEGRAVADIAAVADPYTGLAVHDTSSGCEFRYKEAKVAHVLYWCTIGGTSLASPVIAATWALAGGAQGAEYPARLLYENQRYAPSLLHDVTAGSNGECASGFNEATGLAFCTAAEEAAASCGSAGICLAGPGYDGPSGVGTPDGLGAFHPPSELEISEAAQRVARETTERERAEREKAEHEREKSEHEKSERERAERESATTTAPPPAVTEPIATPSTGDEPVAAAAVSIQLSAVHLSARAAAALRRARPRLAQVSFLLTASAAGRVALVLARRVRVHGTMRWVSVPYAGTLHVPSGSSSWRLSGSRPLARGSYRLTLTPAHGPPRYLYFSAS